MPFLRPTLSDLQGQVSTDLASKTGSNPQLLRFSNLGVIGNAQAGLAYQHYGYLDWIARQAVPFSCTAEYLEGWAAMRGVYRNPARVASGSVTFSGEPGAVIPAGATLARPDGLLYSTTMLATINQAGQAVVPVSAQADPSGQSGAVGNSALGVTLSLAQSIAGVQAAGTVTTAIVGGLDIETDDSLRTHMLQAWQTPPQGGTVADYVGWALAAPGVTRAWAVPGGFGVGTVVLYVMMDDMRAGGMPVGSNGVAGPEVRGVAATGDQLAVANVIYPVQPALALVYVVAPVPYPVNMTIGGVPAAMQAASSNALAALLLDQGAVGGTVPFGSVWQAVVAVVTGQYVTVLPGTDIVCPAGSVPVLGNVTYL
jgi:uncharacterized phage protein gp47/JayE